MIVISYKLTYKSNTISLLKCITQKNNGTGKMNRQTKIIKYIV